MIGLDSLDTLLSSVSLRATPAFSEHSSSFIVIIRTATFKAPRFCMACDLEQNLQANLEVKHSTVLDPQDITSATHSHQPLKMCGSDIFLGLVAILFPPLAVWVKRGICSADSLINIALCSKS